MTSLNVMVISLVAYKGLGQLEPDMECCVASVDGYCDYQKPPNTTIYTCPFLASIN